MEIKWVLGNNKGATVKILYC
ncbi:hypothetical protein RDABS01_033888 [Bienertia sinuspersici]